VDGLWRAAGLLVLTLDGEQVTDNSCTKALTSAAAPERVFAALTDPDQVTAWWNAKSTTGSGEAGGELRITFGAEEQATVMRVLAARRPDVVVWEVTSSPLVPDSAGTRPAFTMTAAGDGCRLGFTHYGLVPQLECFELCNVDWGRFLVRLVTHAEQRG
jgi:uncharacterized protein YndB with AHSA1/START domain